MLHLCGNLFSVNSSHRNIKKKLYHASALFCSKSHLNDSHQRNKAFKCFVDLLKLEEITAIVTMSAINLRFSLMEHLRQLTSDSFDCFYFAFECSLPVKLETFSDLKTLRFFRDCLSSKQIIPTFSSCFPSLRFLKQHHLTCHRDCSS